MVDDDYQLPGQAALGYLMLHGCGDVTSRDMRRLLAAFEDAYGAVGYAEWLITERLIATRRLERWSRRWGPPELMMPWASAVASQFSLTRSAYEPETPLVVSRVALRSPGFWEFMGSLNPLEVTRRYLNDRHERKKDRDYRSPAEAERLALENALLGLDVLERLGQLDREHDFRTGEAELLRRHIVGTVREPLRRLGELDDLGLISGGSAQTSRERLPEPKSGTKPEP